ncbi:MAG TPA: hypothetical protein DD381_02790 [Lentisphaeria bacterium]|nr:MAG: hypothetical protein A2X47_03465 [Lentisphaerae bacterium GWF2_38_69]HBM15262.1 hypothetical protein [Lentisphaeria bacterium]
MKIRNKLLIFFISSITFIACHGIAQEDTIDEDPHDSISSEDTSSDDEDYSEETVNRIEFRYSPYDRDNTDVNGVKFGVPMSSGLGTVEGAEISLVSSDTANIKGFQGAILVNMTNYIEGFQMGIANMIRQHGTSGQLGIICFTAKRVEGFQASLFNYSRVTEGLQIGVINYAEDISSFQLGILCYNKEAWIPMLVGINFDPAIFESSYEEEDETASDQEGHTVEEAETEITPDTTSDTAKMEAKAKPWYNFLGW